MQAAGRLLRGGVPFRAWFVDAAWAPKNAGQPPLLKTAEREEEKQNDSENDTPATSLLAAVIDLLGEYAAETGTVGHALYRPLADALTCMEDDGFRFAPEKKEDSAEK